MIYEERRFLNQISFCLITASIILHLIVLYQTNYCPQLITIFAKIIFFLNTDFFEKIFIALLAWSLAFFSQNALRRIDRRKEIIKEAGKFNESVFYTSIVIENFSSELEQIIFPLLFSEEEQTRKLQASIAEKKLNVHYSFTSYPPTDVIEEKNLLEKIPNLGNHLELAQAFYRVRNAQINFNKICEERSFLIKRFLEIQKEITNPVFAIDRTKEIIQRSYVALLKGEEILDGLIFISRKLSEVRFLIRKNLQENGIKNIKTSEIPLHPHWNDFRVSLRDMIDQREGINRHLHMPR